MTSINYDVGTSQIEVAKELLPMQRKSILIQNISTGSQIIYLGVYGQQAESGKGIVLYPGGFWSESTIGNFYPDEHKIMAISDSVDATISVSERI